MLPHQNPLSEDYQCQETSGVAEALDRVNGKEYQLMKSHAGLGEHILTQFVEGEDIL
jgi:hypothetical protein